MYFATSDRHLFVLVCFQDVGQGSQPDGNWLYFPPVVVAHVSLYRCLSFFLSELPSVCLRVHLCVSVCVCFLVCVKISTCIAEMLSGALTEGVAKRPERFSFSCALKECVKLAPLGRCGKEKYDGNV